MKKLIKLLFIILLITGCVYQEQQKKLIKTNVLKQQEVAYISNQRKIKNEKGPLLGYNGFNEKIIY